MTLEQLRELHRHYWQAASAIFDRDASTRPAGVWSLINFLEAHGVRRLGEFGGGFSTLALRTWALQSGSHIEITTVDHHAEWRTWLLRLLESRGLGGGKMMDLTELREQSRMFSHHPFDCAFVDHGPTMGSRFDDIPWIISLVAPGGVVVFDDWWAVGTRAFRSTKRLIRILHRMGLPAEVIENSRPSPNDKAIAVVRL